MTIRNLRSAVAGIQQNRRIRAIALEVINGRATVKLAGSSQLLYGLSITGGTIVAGQEVYVDYTTGNPVVHSYQEDSPSVSLATRTKVREIIRDPEIPLSVSNHTHVESQITDLLHNAASIRGRTITTGSPSDGNTLLWDESSGSWIYGAGGEIEEAPIDGKIYGRKDGSWSEVTSGSGGGVTDHTELTNIGINTHDEIDTALLRLANTSGSNTGDQDLSSYLTDASSDGKTYGRKNGQWSEITSSGSGGGIEEAPVDGATYGRNSGSWVNIQDNLFITSGSFSLGLSFNDNTGGTYTWYDMWVILYTPTIIKRIIYDVHADGTYTFNLFGLDNTTILITSGSKIFTAGTDRDFEIPETVMQTGMYRIRIEVSPAKALKRYTTGSYEFPSGRILRASPTYSNGGTYDEIIPIRIHHTPIYINYS